MGVSEVFRGEAVQAADGPSSAVSGRQYVDGGVSDHNHLIGGDLSSGYRGGLMNESQETLRMRFLGGNEFPP